jgi:hypothetical protein
MRWRQSACWPTGEAINQRNVWVLVIEQGGCFGAPFFLELSEAQVVVESKTIWF